MKKHTTSTLAAVITTLVMLLAMATPAFAQNGTALVTASVEMEQYCVNLELGSDLTFGAAGIGDAVQEINDHAIIVRNSGTGAATIMIQGTDATGPNDTGWSLSDSPGPGAFAWYFINNAPESDGSAVFVSKDARVLVPILGYQETVALNATLMTPTCTRTPGTYNWSATVYAVPVSQ